MLLEKSYQCQSYLIYTLNVAKNLTYEPCECRLAIYLQYHSRTLDGGVSKGLKDLIEGQNNLIMKGRWSTDNSVTISRNQNHRLFRHYANERSDP